MGNQQLRVGGIKMEFQKKLKQVFKENQIEIIEFKGEKDQMFNLWEGLFL